MYRKINAGARATTPTKFTSLSSTPTSNSSIYTSSSMTHTHTTTTTNTESSSSAAIVIGVGVGLGGLVLIIVSSLLIAKFVFHKEIPLPFKSSRGRNSPPHQTGSDVISGGYEQIEDNKLTESMESKPTCSNVVTPHPPSNSTLIYIGFQDLIQPNSDS